MNKLILALDEATRLLKQLTSATLTAEQLELTKNGLSGLNGEGLVDNFLDIHNANNAGDDTSINSINKKADEFNDELQRIKKIKNTLNLEALEPVISAASYFIRPVYQLTASMHDEYDKEE